MESRETHLSYEGLMHLLCSAAIGTEVIDNTDHQVHGVITGTIIDSDRGKVIGFYIQSPFTASPLVLQTQDITSWGARVHIREPEVLGIASDIIRIRDILSDGRSFLGQNIRTKSGSFVGKCLDAQFNTNHFDIEWIFPRKFFRKGLALPASDIVEVTIEAIIIKDQVPREEKIVAVSAPDLVEPTIDSVINPAPGCSAQHH